MLIAYSGKDPEDTPFSVRVTGWECTRHSRQLQAYRRFLFEGDDTMKLAERYGVKESTVVRWISNERSKRRNLPSPYGVNP
jgi:transposase